MRAHADGKAPRPSGAGESLIADFTRGSCGTPFHEGVHFVNIDGKRMRVWYLGGNRYRVAGQTRVVFDPQGAVSEAPGTVIRDATFSVDAGSREVR